MKRLMVVLALIPALAAAQGTPARTTGKPAAGSGQGAGPGGGPDDPARLERMQKRMRLSATLGLAEALDLDEQGAMRVRDVFSRDNEKRFPIYRQLHDGMRALRDAARGDKAAAGQVDATIAKLRDARAQLHKLNDETFQQLTNGLSPDKKAKTLLFLGRLRERGQHMRMGAGGPGGDGPGWGPGGRGRGGPGPGFRGGGDGPGQGPGPSGMRGPAMMERHASAAGDSAEPELEDWFAYE